MNIRIVSGGQTGVDRAALDAALESGVEAGGWCPEGRKAEDGVIPEMYPVVVLPGKGYRQRTRRNVLDSDATIIIYFSHPTGGTEQTLLFCIQERRPYLLLDAEDISPTRAIKRTLTFIDQNQIKVLNVAGPRASGEPRAYDYTRQLILGVLGVLREP